MKSLIVASGLVISAASGAFAQTESMTKLSQAECASLWSKASPNGSPITENQSAGYVTDFKAANPDGDTTIEKDEFTKACDNGLVKSAASTGVSTGEAGSGNTPETLHPPTNRVGEQVPTMRSEENAPDAQGSKTYQPQK